MPETLSARYERPHYVTALIKGRDKALKAGHITVVVDASVLVLHVVVFLFLYVNDRLLGLSPSVCRQDPYAGNPDPWDPHGGWPVRPPGEISPQ